MSAYASGRDHDRSPTCAAVIPGKKANRAATEAIVRHATLPPGAAPAAVRKIRSETVMELDMKKYARKQRPKGIGSPGARLDSPASWSTKLNMVARKSKLPTL